MNQRTVKTIYLIIHIFLTVALIIAVVPLLLQQILPVRSTEPQIDYLVPVLLHLILSCLGMIPALNLPATGRNEIERDLLPLMYLMISLSDIPVASYALIHGFNGLITLTFIARIHIFAVLFTVVLMLYMGLFHLGINTGKIVSFTVIAATGCLLLTSLVPLAVHLHPFAYERWVADNHFRILVVIMALLAIFNYVALAIRERTQHMIFRATSISLVIAGHLLYLSRAHAAAVWIGIILFAAGILVGIPRGRFSQLQ